MNADHQANQTTQPPLGVHQVQERPSTYRGLLENSAFDNGAMIIRPTQEKFLSATNSNSYLYFPKSLWHGPNDMKKRVIRVGRCICLNGIEPLLTDHRPRYFPIFAGDKFSLEI